MTYYSARATRLSVKSLLLASVAAIVAGASPGIAFAQEAARPVETQDSTAQDVTAERYSAKKPAPSASDQEIVVVGTYGKSLSEARKIKKDSVIQKDAIVAEDIAKFPELNLAESLQRVPGVQITREAGEGRRISLRGLGPDFARVQLNGMEVLGNVNSAQDSRGQRSRDRAFDFNIFASELFSKVEVEKTYEAAQNEGGMAGTVGLFTGKPFDYKDGWKGAIVAKGGSNQYTKDFQPRVAALLSRNWDDKFGILVSVAYSKRKTTEQGHDDYNYDKLSASNAAKLVGQGLDISHLSAAQQTKFLSGTLLFPDGDRLSSFDARQKRLGITAAMQYRPADNLLFTLDALHGEFTTHRDEYHLATRPIASGTASFAFDGPAGSAWPALFKTPSTINDIQWDANNYVTKTDVTGTTFGSEHRRELNKNRFNQIALTVKWDVNDRFTIDGHGGYEKSKYDTPYDDKLYMRAKGNQIADYGADGRSVSFQYPNSDLTNPNNYTMDDFYYRAFNNHSELREGVLNLRYKLNDVLTFRAGAAYHRFEQGGASYFYDGGVNGTNAETRGTSVADITSVFKNSFGSWLVGDFSKAFAKYHEYHRLGPKPDGTGGTIQDIENVYDTSEETIDGYAQMDWDTELFGLRFRGNAGVRGYRTNTHSIGWIQGSSYAYLGSADVKGHYSGVLPALNTVLELNPEVLVRFSATQNLNRPTLSSMAAQGTASVGDDGSITASRGNPGLKPFKDTTVDVAAEYYFGKVGLLSAAVFHKWIKDFIGSQTLTNVPFSQTGVPSSVIPGATDSTIVKEFDVPINVPGTKTLTGVEVAAQAQMTFLPAPFNNLGVVANFTYVDPDKALTGISKTSYNLTVYYETKRWGARASLSHRSLYYTGRASDGAPPTDASTRGFEPTTYVDAAAFFNITDRLQLTADAINLTNQKDTQFWGTPRYLYNQTQSGTTYMGGFSYKF
ncbi:TonB-dependent receptor [Sphingomonas sp. MMS24-J13]|uniref:TonB-dependent receptor n=1 Tax=Sphingomonas sp. MMS24-J13 TaxID=3238686 RepID=UPI0038514190